MKWSLQVVFETDLLPEAANVFCVYMSVHAIYFLDVFLTHFSLLFFPIITL